MSDSFDTILRRAFDGSPPGKSLALTLPARPGLWAEVLGRSGGAWDDEPRVFWARGAAEDGIWVGRGAAQILRSEGPGRFSALQKLVEECFLSIGYYNDILHRLRVFGGGAFLSDDTSSPGAVRAFGNASFVLPRVTYVDCGGDSTLTVVSDGRDLDALLDFLEPLMAPGDAAPGSLGRTDGAPPVPLQLEATDRDHFKALVRKIQRGIAAGDFDKVVLARRVRVHLERDPTLGPLLVRLLESGPDSVRFALAQKDSAFLGATPERLVRVRGTELEADALAGTIPKSARGARELLLGSVKDRSEHAFVVRAIEAALAPLAEELTIGDEPEITELPELLHLRTPIRARLRQRIPALELVARLHPTPAVGGFPREPALRFIEENEPEPRGWYAGPFGWIDESGDGEFVVALRSAFLDGRVADLFAGAGIVSGSDPDAEFEETELKLGRMLSALGFARESRGREADFKATLVDRDQRAPARQP